MNRIDLASVTVMTEGWRPALEIIQESKAATFFEQEAGDLFEARMPVAHVPDAQKQVISRKSSSEIQSLCLRQQLPESRVMSHVHLKYIES